MIDIYKLGVRSIILTSGTLSPMDSVESELKLPFKVRLENSHVVTGKQVWIGSLKCGPTKKLLTSRYEHRDKPEYKEELGRTISNCLRQIPNGLLVFSFLHSNGPLHKLLEAKQGWVLMAAN